MRFWCDLGLQPSPTAPPERTQSISLLVPPTQPTSFLFSSSFKMAAVQQDKKDTITDMEQTDETKFVVPGASSRSFAPAPSDVDAGKANPRHPGPLCLSGFSIKELLGAIPFVPPFSHALQWRLIWWKEGGEQKRLGLGFPPSTAVPLSRDEGEASTSDTPSFSSALTGPSATSDLLSTRRSTCTSFTACGVLILSSGADHLACGLPPITPTSSVSVSDTSLTTHHSVQDVLTITAFTYAATWIPAGVEAAGLSYWPSKALSFALWK